MIRATSVTLFALLTVAVGCSNTSTGSGGGDGGTSSGSSGGGACAKGTTECGACINANCCVAVDACFNDTGCARLWNCAADCTTDACVTECRYSANGDAVVGYGDVMSCFSNKCGGKCGG